MTKCGGLMILFKMEQHGHIGIQVEALVRFSDTKPHGKDIHRFLVGLRERKQQIESRL